MVAALEVNMLRFLVPLAALVFVTGAQAAPAAPSLPTLTDCVRADTVICTFRLVRTGDLNAGRTAILAAPSGMPKIDRIELRRIDDDLLLLVEYFAPDPALRGVAF
jgi:hypothetical protein